MSVFGAKTFDAVFDSQRVFRCLLQATAQPGKLFALPPTGVAHLEAVALTLLDHEVAFCVIGEEDGEMEERLACATGSRPVTPAEADFALVLGGSGGAVAGLRRGSLERPEGGATAISPSAASTRARSPSLSGPGVPAERTLDIEGLATEEAEAIRKSCEDYPLGVDVYLVDEAGQVARVAALDAAGGGVVAYTAVKGGEQAIKAAEKLENAAAKGTGLTPEAVLEGMGYAVDQVMGEAGLYAPRLAARAVVQAQGDLAEAAFLLRAYRSTLPRQGYTAPADTDDARLVRRVSSAFKDVPGGQILGPTRDYSQRLLGLEREDEPSENGTPGADGEGNLPRITDALREAGLVAKRRPEKGGEPFDLTREALTIPASRSGAVAEPGARGGWCDDGSGVQFPRGFGAVHPTLAEFRVGYLPLRVEHPILGEQVEVGEISCTEVEAVGREMGYGGESRSAAEGAESNGAPDSEAEEKAMSLGYGLVFGRNERKAIAMAILDAAIRAGAEREQGPGGPAEDEEFVLYHADGIEATGFVEHLKLPHYVTFQSSLDRLREIQNGETKVTVDELLKNEGTANGPSYNHAFLDEGTKRELRRKTLKAVSIPGHQVPFGSREMPLARGWGTGGLQLSLALVGPGDVYKAIDQGADDSVNAVNMRSLVSRMAEVETTTDAREATIIQTRHRIPEEPLREDQTMVFQVPIPEPLERVEPRISRARRMHAEKDYSKMWLFLYESIARHGEITVGARYPVVVNGTYLMDPSPIPRWDVPKLDNARFLSLFGAGREKRIYAIPPHTTVEPLEFEDHRFRVERFGEPCRRCGSTDTYLDELTDEATGEAYFQCSDTSFCDRRLEEGE